MARALRGASHGWRALAVAAGMLRRPAPKMTRSVGKAPSAPKSSGRVSLVTFFGTSKESHTPRKGGINVGVYHVANRPPPWPSPFMKGEGKLKQSPP